MSKLILLSGPSCVGKSPLYRTFCHLFPEHARQMEKIVLYNDRAPRPGEREGQDYFFRTTQEIEEMGTRPGFLRIQVRNDLQLLELDTLQRILDRGCHVFFEGAPYIVSSLLEEGIMNRVPTQSIFLSPLNREEILFLLDPGRRINLYNLVTDIMRKKLLRRKHKQMGYLSTPDLEDIEVRCRTAYRELGVAYRFDYVIPNHDGEDSEHWSTFPYPIGEALQSVLDFVSIVEDQPRPRIERWEKDLLPPTEQFL